MCGYLFFDTIPLSLVIQRVHPVLFMVTKRMCINCGYLYGLSTGRHYIFTFIIIEFIYFQIKAKK